MFGFYVFVLVLDTSFALRISPPNSCINCYNDYPNTCQERLELTCHDGAETEWLDKNSRSITTTDNTARIHTEGTTLVFLSRQTTDEGSYTCRRVHNQNIKANVNILVKAIPHFTYSCNPNSRFFSDEQTVLRYQDNFINCSFAPTVNFSNSTNWDYRNRLLNTDSHPKYSQNTSGLIIRNFTKADEGIYKCLIGNGDPLIATINVILIWPPELPITQNQTVLVNVSEQVVLNCTVSSSPDPVYNWSTPDTCSSCPHTNSDNVMIFTADITDSGEYVCEAGNEYGRVMMTFDIKVFSKPIVLTESHTIIKEERENILLTCDLKYAYPVPSVTWSIKSVLSDNYIVIKNSSVERDYSLHKNFTIEIYHRFLSEAGYLNVMCSVENLYGSAQMVYHLWEDAAFKAKIDFVLYITNFMSCQEVKKDKYGLFAELLASLREWFNSVCHCNGYNNLYTPQLTCLNHTTGYITSIVRHEGVKSAQQLINLAVANITNNTANFSQHGWILFLELPNDTKNTPLPNNTPTPSHSSEITDVSISIIIGVTVGAVCVLIVSILCIAAAVVYGMHRRKSDTTDQISVKSPHMYDDVDRFSALKTRNTDCDVNKSPTDNKIIFEMNGMQPPAYCPLSTPLYDNPVCTKKRNEKGNDYQIDDEVENAKENKNNQFQKGEKYDKLFHHGQ